MCVDWKTGPEHIPASRKCINCVMAAMCQFAPSFMTINSSNTEVCMVSYTYVPLHIWALHNDMYTWTKKLTYIHVHTHTHRHTHVGTQTHHDTLIPTCYQITSQPSCMKTIVLLWTNLSCGLSATHISTELWTQMLTRARHPKPFSIWSSAR